MMNKDITEILENLIDKHGLLHVITGLELVCNEKAEHILHNWQDTKTAKVWNKASDSLYICAKKIEDLNI